MGQIVEVLESIWGQFIEFTSQFVVPDWGYLVSLLPLAVLGLVLLFLGWIGYRYATAGPTRRGPRRIAPLPPASLHMPGPSMAPFLGALGAAALFFGLVFGGVMLWLGLAALVLALLYWGREALRDYDHLEAADGTGHGAGARALAAGPGGQAGGEMLAAAAAAPAAGATGGSLLPVPLEPARRAEPEPSGPPEGVHIPGPSWRPIIVSIATAILFVGLVTGGPLIVAGLLAVFVALIGWLTDARHEYRAVEVADETGHLETETAPRAPIGTLIAFALLIVGAMGVNFVMNGALLGSGPAPSAAPEGSPVAGASAEPGSSPAGSEAPVPEADITITAQNIAYLETEVTAPADTPFTIAFVNLDAGVPHNVAIHEGSPTGPELWKGDIFNGVETRVYEVPALPAGTYGFICSVHPNMTGTLIAK